MYKGNLTSSIRRIKTNYHRCYLHQYSQNYNYHRHYYYCRFIHQSSRLLNDKNSNDNNNNKSSITIGINNSKQLLNEQSSEKSSNSSKGKLTGSKSRKKSTQKKDQTEGENNINSQTTTGGKEGEANGNKIDESKETTNATNNDSHEGESTRANHDNLNPVDFNVEFESHGQTNPVESETTEATPTPSTTSTTETSSTPDTDSTTDATTSTNTNSTTVTTKEQLQQQEDDEDNNGDNYLTTIFEKMEPYMDTYQVYKQLTDSGFTSDQADEVIRLLIVQLNSKLSKLTHKYSHLYELENEKYLFESAQQELRVDITRSREQHINELLNLIQNLERDYNIIQDELNNDLLQLKTNNEVTINDQKQENTLQSKRIILKIQETNHKITTELNSYMRSEVESLRWNLSRWGLISILVCVFSGCASFYIYKRKANNRSNNPDEFIPLVIYEPSEFDEDDYHTDLDESIVH